MAYENQQNERGKMDYKHAFVSLSPIDELDEEGGWAFIVCKDSPYVLQIGDGSHLGLVWSLMGYTPEQVEISLDTGSPDEVRQAQVWATRNIMAAGRINQSGYVTIWESRQFRMCTPETMKEDIKKAARRWAGERVNVLSRLNEHIDLLAERMVNHPWKRFYRFVHEHTWAAAREVERLERLGFRFQLEVYSFGIVLRAYLKDQTGYGTNGWWTVYSGEYDHESVDNSWESDPEPGISYRTWCTGCVSSLRGIK